MALHKFGTNYQKSYRKKKTDNGEIRLVINLSVELFMGIALQKILPPN